MKHRLFVAETKDHFDDAKDIIIAYSGFLGIDLAFQGFSNELESLKEMYSSPTGCMILAEASNKVVGAVGLRYLSDGVAEMKRMFVLPEFQGHGIGNSLVIEVLKQAKRLGYHSVKLDSIPELDSALALYTKHGFSPIKSYRYNPHPSAIFMERMID